MAIALAFGIPALRYPIGEFGRAGPGLFPLMVSGLLLLVGIATVVRARFIAPVPMHFNVRNIGLILGALCAFALVSLLLNMTAGIVALVFVATAAGSNYSVMRNIKISVGLLAIAFAFVKFLGVNLPLY
ncbi:tripartite tricarboxylate transporter TctB family protein [Ramlibacter humi]|uniref:Tripartite tricarboxylate transporter TctB family protein n=2 Tax=Ramlibacter humi TaxID=2530451 RepID=A0A4Z0BKJ0_9BURK|nr:tripartite tricarboxylate transporter TctB family protein [Ramlibacter humi]